MRYIIQDMLLSIRYYFRRDLMREFNKNLAEVELENKLNGK